MEDLKKRIVLTRFWIGDTVYALADGARGQVTMVQICTDRFVPRYYVVMADRSGEWCEEMELSAQKVFTSEKPAETP